MDSLSVHFPEQGKQEKTGKTTKKKSKPSSYGYLFLLPHTRHLTHQVSLGFISLPQYFFFPHT